MQQDWCKNKLVEGKQRDTILGKDSKLYFLKNKDIIKTLNGCKHYRVAA